MNKTSYFLFYLTLGLMLFISIGVNFNVNSQERMFTIKVKEIEQFAQTSLNNYVKNVLTEKNVERFGFKTIGEAKKSRIGEPLPLKTIALRDLKAYSPGSGLKSIPADLEISWFPVVVDGEVRAQLEIFHKSGRMLSGAFGATRTAQRLSKARQQLPILLQSKNIERAEVITIVRINALKVQLLHVETVNGNFLISAMSSPQRYDLKDGELYSADEILLLLKEYAKDLPDDLVG